jgi:hypothetical protein
MRINGPRHVRDSGRNRNHEYDTKSLDASIDPEFIRNLWGWSRLLIPRSLQRDAAGDFAK